MNLLNINKNVILIIFLNRNLIVAHNLPDDYPYYRYVRKCLQEVLVHITEVDFKVWLIVEVLVFICLFMDVITGE